MGLSVVHTPAFTPTHLNPWFSHICFLVTGAGLGHPDALPHGGLLYSIQLTPYHSLLLGIKRVIPHSNPQGNSHKSHCAVMLSLGQKCEKFCRKPQAASSVLKYLVSGIISRANGLTDDCAGHRSSRGKEDKNPQPLQGLKVSSKDKGCL